VSGPLPTALALCNRSDVAGGRVGTARGEQPGRELAVSRTHKARPGVVVESLAVGRDLVEVHVDQVATLCVEGTRRDDRHVGFDASAVVVQHKRRRTVSRGARGAHKATGRVCQWRQDDVTVGRRRTALADARPGGQVTRRGHVGGVQAAHRPGQGSGAGKHGKWHHTMSPGNGGGPLIMKAATLLITLCLWASAWPHWF
jgi:hypothetical protein